MFIYTEYSKMHEDLDKWNFINLEKRKKKDGYTCIPQCTARDQGKNPENEGLPGKADGVLGIHPGEAHSCPAGWFQYKQEEEGEVCGFTCEKCLIVTPLRLTVFSFFIQNVTHEIHENLISLNEILEVSFLVLQN